MRKAPLLLATAIMASLFTASPMAHVEAMPFAPLAAPSPGSGTLLTHVWCRCDRTWARRQYWRWDHRPIWDDPWTVLRPTIWGSPEPYLVPADIWARKWHLPRHHAWGWRRHPW